MFKLRIRNMRWKLTIFLLRKVVQDIDKINENIEETVRSWVRDYNYPRNLIHFYEEAIETNKKTKVSVIDVIEFLE